MSPQEALNRLAALENRAELLYRELTDVRSALMDLRSDLTPWLPPDVPIPAAGPPTPPPEVPPC